MAGFKSAAKRKRELAKLDKRHAKDQKRAARKAAASVGAAPAPNAAIAEPLLAKHQPTPGAARVQKQTTLAEAVERWKRTKVAKPTKR